MKAKRLLFALLIFFYNASNAQTIADFAWLAGSWKGDGLGGLSEESWSPASGNTMMGMYKHTKEGEVTFYEFMLIVQEQSGFVMKIKHFSPDMTGWEEKDKSVTFPLVRVSPTEIIFDGLEIEKKSENELQLRVNIGDKDGEIQVAIFNYIRSNN